MDILNILLLILSGIFLVLLILIYIIIPPHLLFTYLDKKSKKPFYLLPVLIAIHLGITNLLLYLLSIYLNN